MAGKRYTEKFKARALALAEKIGVRAAAEKLGCHFMSIQKWKKAATPPGYLPGEREDDRLTLSEATKMIVDGAESRVAVVEAMNKLLERQNCILNLALDKLMEKGA